MICVNASNFNITKLNPHCIVYSATDKDLIPYISFNQAQKLTTWQNLFYPFAQIIVNPSNGEFILVRDHLGVRPLYYYHNAGQLIFGDTIPDVLRHLPAPVILIDTEISDIFADAPQYTDKTIYPGIYRVEPGHMMHCKLSGFLVKAAFWQLELHCKELHYHDEREYVEHFAALMDEAIRDATHNSANVAAEFSAGMDSSAIYCASMRAGLNPPLFMHAAVSGSTSDKIYNKVYENTFIQHFPAAIIHRIMDEDFAAIRVFKQYSSWFGVPAPYMFELFAHNLHRAVAATKHTILLSGFGGDQGVSGHIPARFILPELIKNKQYLQAWRESTSYTTNTAKLGPLARSLLIMQCVHPLLHRGIHMLRDLKLSIYNASKPSKQKPSPNQHPYHTEYFKTLRAAEWSFLQGPNSHEIRTRIEYSSIVAKKMGFEYRYPLLHPKLLEFFLSLPLSQKRHQGKGRYMMRRYLARHLPHWVFDSYNKKEGLAILAATMDTFKAQWIAGIFQEEFHELPYAQLIQDHSPHKTMIKTVQAFMLKELYTQID